MRYRLSIVLLSGILSIHNLGAQPQIALLKHDKIITKYEEGEYIRFQRKGDDGFIRAIITGIHPGFFIVGADSIYSYEVAKVDIRKKSQRNYKVSVIGLKIIEAGVLLFAADLFNTTVIQDRTYRWNDSAANTSMIIIGAGALMQVVNNDIFKINHKRKLVTVNLN